MKKERRNLINIRTLPIPWKDLPDYVEFLTAYCAILDGGQLQIEIGVGALSDILLSINRNCTL